MEALKKLFLRFTPAYRTAKKKRRLEVLLRDAGLSRSIARRVIAAYFAD